MGGWWGRRGAKGPSSILCTQNPECSQEEAGGQLWFPLGCEHDRLDRPKQPQTLSAGHLDL